MHPEIDRYAHLGSFVHRWDPRWKLAALASLILAFGFVGEEARLHPTWRDDLPPALVAFAVSAALVRLSRIPLTLALRSLRPALVFLAFLLVVLPLTYPHASVDPLGSLSVGWFTLSGTGLLLAILIALRAVAIVLLVFPMFGTTPFHDSMKALRALHVPARLVQLVTFSYRYLFVFADEVRRMQIAWKVKGFRAGCNRHSLRVVGNGVGMLVVGSLARSRRIHRAMLCRGFHDGFRTLSTFRTRPADVLLTAGFMGIAFGFFAWRAW